eukprot:Em0001g227a
MLIKEYRIILPFTLEEYRVGQLYSIAEMSKSETGGGEGVEVLKNETVRRQRYDGERPQPPPELLAKREVIYVDMVNDPIQPNDYKQDQDPSLYRCERANRGPLAKDWKESPAHPFMCAYKLVTCEFKWFGLQGTVEGRIQKVYPRLFRNLHRQIFCCMDKWYGLTMDDIRRIEEETKAELDRQRLNEPARGTREE